MFGPMDKWVTATWAIAAALMIAPGAVSTLIGIAMVVPVLLRQVTTRLRGRRAAAA